MPTDRDRPRARWAPASLLAAAILAVPADGTAQDLPEWLEKTAVDLQQFGGSRDFGVALRGDYGGEDRGWYHLQVGNGAGTGGEVNEGKQVAGSLGYRFDPGFLVEGYADYEDRSGGAERATFQAFGGWEGELGRAGLQFVHQHRERAEGGARGSTTGSPTGSTSSRTPSSSPTPIRPEMPTRTPTWSSGPPSR